MLIIYEAAFVFCNDFFIHEATRNKKENIFFY